MKKHTLYYIALSALAMLTGCSNEENFGLKPTDGNRSLTATIEQNDLSRTAVSEEGQVTWTETDAIGVFGTASQNIRFTYQSSTDNGNSATFRGDFHEEETMEQAYYPYQEDATLSGNALTLNLPSEYTYTGNSNAPMLGIKNNDGTFTFKHLTGLLRITINNVPEEADRFVITSSGETDAPDLAGQATITDINAEDATLSITANGSKSITYNLGTLTEETGFRTFFVPLPVGDYPQLSVALYAKDSTDPYFTKTISDITVRRAVMIDMPILDAQTGAQYVLSENTIQLSKEDESYIESVEQTGGETSDENIITYQSDTPSDKLPKVGDILLYNEITEKFPSGFLGRVTKVEETNNGYAIYTVPAALDEAFDQLYIDEVYDLIPEDSEITQSRIIISPDEDGFFCFQFPVTIEKGAYSVNGSITNGYKLHLHFELNNESDLPPYAFVTFQNKIATDFGFGIHTESDPLEFFNIPLVSFPLNKTPGTLVFTPSIDLFFVAEGTGSVGLDANVDYSKITVGTVLYNKGKWEAGANDIDSKGFLNINMDSNKSLTLQGSIFMGFGVGLNLKLFNNNNVKIGIEPKAGLTETASLTFDLSSLDQNSYEILKDSKLDTSLGVNIDAEVSAGIFKDDEALLKAPIFSWNFFEKPYYLFPTFEEPIINVDKESKTAEVNYNVTRDLVFPAGIGVRLYEEDVLTATSSVENYVREETYENPLQATFDNLMPGLNYKVHPYVSFLNFAFEATPMGTFTLEDDEEDPAPETPLIVTTGESTNVTLTSATLSGSLTNMQPDETYTYGFIYSTDKGNVTIDNGTKVEVSVMEENRTFSTTLTLLEENMTYYWCAYACDGAGNYTYGDVEIFATIELTPEQKKERDILIAFYKATGGDNWRHNTNWCTAAPLHEWYGISVSVDYSTGEAVYGNVTSIDLTNNNLIGNADLSGLVDLGYIGLRWNRLTNLNISGLTKLRHIDVRESRLSSLNVAGFKELSYLDCSSNQLQTLDIAGCTALVTLNCAGNDISNLDVSEMTKLSSLSCGSNNLTSLYVPNCENLSSLSCADNPLNNLEIDGCNNIEYLSYGGEGAYLPNIDPSRFTKLKRLSIYGCGITKLNVSTLKDLTSFSCINNLLTHIDVSNLTKLISMYVDNNKLNELDVSALKELRILSCDNNQLTKLDVSMLDYLHTLYCRNNQLTDLKVTQAISNLQCNDNQLSSLDLSNTEFEDLFLSCKNNPLKIVYLPSSSQEYFGKYDQKNKFTLWGEYGSYPRPNHINGYQYPEFIFK